MRFARFVMGALLLTAVSTPVEAQSFRDRLKQKAKEKIEQKVNETDEQAVEENETPDDAEQTATKSSNTKPGQGAWSNFDFVPGERVLFFEDFSGDEVGNFPRRLEFMYGSMEIVESNGVRYLSAASEDDWVAIQLPEKLPQRFTIEWDMTIPANWESHLFFSMEGIEAPGSGGADGSHIKTPSVFLTYPEAGLKRGNGEKVSARNYTQLIDDLNNSHGTLMRMRLHVDGKYVKVYVNELRVANVPNLDIPRTDKIYFSLMGQEESPMLIGNISVNAGGKKMYDALLADGRVVTQGIYFDTGSDRIRPESSGTLKEISVMLKEHADLRLMIEGHTDNVGSAVSNQKLSEKRAAAIKAALTSTYGVDAGRLETTGLGATKPAVSNETAEGRQSNRRVELVKI